MTTRTQVMGVMNITPDSFYAGSRLHTAAEADASARKMLAEGADWVDIGGESSRPGAEPVGLDEELRRVLPAVEAVAALGAKVSVDTYRAETARRALAAGARMVNDITALRGDVGMAEVVAQTGCLCCLMHMQGDPKTMQQAPHYDNVIDEICAFFEERIAFAVSQGIRREQLWLDPGFGFGKTVDHNLEILRRLDAFGRFGLPVLIGTSNKSTIGAVLGTTVEERTEGTAATVAVSVMKGAASVRVHDVRAMARVVRMTEAILHGSEVNHG